MTRATRSTPSSTSRAPAKAATTRKKPAKAATVRKAPATARKAPTKAATTRKPPAKATTRKAPTRSTSSKPAAKATARKAPAKPSSGTRRKPPAPVVSLDLDELEPSELVGKVEAFCTSRRGSSDWSPRLEALAALATTLARELTRPRAEGQAGLARELRETLLELAPAIAPNDALDFLAASATPVE